MAPCHGVPPTAPRRNSLPRLVEHAPDSVGALVQRAVFVPLAALQPFRCSRPCAGPPGRRFTGGYFVEDVAMDLLMFVVLAARLQGLLLPELREGEVVRGSPA